MKVARHFRPSSLAAIILPLFLMTAFVSVHAQLVLDKPTVTDLKSHKFQPKVLPEQAASTPAAQTPGPNGMSMGAAQQIQALEQEKESRTAAQQKIDSNVLYTLRMLQGRPAAAGVPYLYTGIDLDENNNVIVDITAYVTDSLLQQVTSAGGQILNTNKELRSIRAIVPPGQLEAIASSPDVIFISPKQGWATHRVERAPKFPAMLRFPMAPGFEQRAARVRQQMAIMLQSVTAGTGQGSVTSEGDATHRAFDARGAFGVNGAGLKIGVLSDGVSSLAASQATGDLGTVTVLAGQGGSGDEGTAMLEIIHDMAPGASLFFATADPTITQFATNIRGLRTAGCDIIVDDVFYFVETPFQDGQTGAVLSTTNAGVVTQAVNDVAAAGALYFSSAGNEGNVDLGTAGAYEADFNGVAASAPLPLTGKVHNFGATLYDTITSGGLGTLFLWWADPLGGSSNDYDLYILDSTGATVVASSTNIQSGTQDGIEGLQAGVATGNRVVVFQKTGALDRFLHISNFRGTLTVATSGETHGHSSASAAGAYSVAATPAAATPFGGPSGPFPSPFNAANQVETFSSDGLRRIFFNGNSTAITPGNFSSTGGTVLNKPDITAADGVSVTGVGGFGSPFFGTSAAAPSAAGVAALVKSAGPALTQAQIRTALTGTAIDIMGGGYDRDSGSGIVMAFEAITSLGVPGFANPELGTVTATENPGNANGIIEAGEGGKLVIQLKNTTGVQTATAISATLTTSTPGVTITQPNVSAYADMPAGTGSGNNLTPFAFTVADTAPCGLTVNFTLTVNYLGTSAQSRVLSFSVPTGVVTFTNVLGTTPAAIPGITTRTGTQVNRISRNAVPSTCASVKAFPGSVAAGSLTFDSYKFTACKATCLSTSISSLNSVRMFQSDYSPSFDPTNITTNFAGDAGASGEGQVCSINTVVSNTYEIVVNDVTGTAVGSTYTLTIPACAFSCSALNHVPLAVVHNVTVVAATVGGTAAASINNGSSDPDGDTLTITQSPAGPYPVGNTSVRLTVTDTKGATAQATATVTVVNPDFFNIAAVTPSVSVTAGQTVTDHITVTPSPATGNTITFSCTGLPALTTCSFTPGTVPPGASPTDVVETITTTASVTSGLERPRAFYAVWMPLSGLGLVGAVLLGSRRKNRKAAYLFVAMTLMLMLALAGCGGGGHTPVTTPGTPAGTFTITTTATTAATTKTTTFTLVVN